MNKVLVVGASGQLGSAVLNQLIEAEQECVAFVRPSSRFSPPVSEHLQVVYGNLTDFSTVDEACIGVNKVIATASSIVPRKGDKFGVDEVENYSRLLAACRHHQIGHFIYISAFSSPYDELVPEFRVKRQVEQLIAQSGIPYTIFRAAAFMDIYYAVMGSRLVLDGVSQPTLLRGFWLTKLYSYLTTGLLENMGLALLPGSGQVRQPFISIHDVAAFMVKALSVATAKNRIIELGGLEVLSWANVADIYAEILGKKISKLTIPCFMLNACRLLLKPFSPAGENIMSILFVLGKYDCFIDMKAVSEEFGVSLTDTRHFLLGKLSSQKVKGKRP